MALSKAIGYILQGDTSITGLSFQPKLLLFFGNHRTSDGSTAGGAHFLGAAVSSSVQLGVGFASQDNVATANPAFTESDTRCIRIVDTTGSTVASASFSAFTSDGCTFSAWNNDDGTDRIINYIALGGTDITNVTLGTRVLGTATGNRSFTSVGFNPDALLFLFTHYAQSNNGGSNNGNLRYTLGFSCLRGGNYYQGYTAALDRTSSNPSVTNRRQMTNKCWGQLTTDDILSEASIVSHDSDGWTWNQTTASGTADSFYFIAIKGAQFAIGAFNQATSTGNQTISSVGITPAVVILQSANNTTSSSTPAHMRYSIGAGVSSSSRFSTWSGATDNVTPSVTDHNLDRTKILKLMTEGTPTVTTAADLVSVASGQFIIDNTTADATAREILYFLIGTATGGSSVTGTGAATFPVFTSSGTGISSHKGTSTLTFPVFTSSGSGISSHKGTSALTFPVFTLSSSGISAHLGSGAVTFPVFTLAGIGAKGKSGTGALTFPVFASAGSGISAHQGSGTMSFPVFLASGTGISAHLGSGAISFPAFITTSTGISSHQGSGGFVFGVFTLLGTGARGTSGTGAFAFPGFTVASTGVSAHQGSGTLQFGVFTISGTGQNPPRGVGAMSFPVFTLASSGISAHQGSGTLVFPVFLSSGSGSAGDSTQGAPAYLVFSDNKVFLIEITDKQVFTTMISSK